MRTAAPRALRQLAQWHGVLTEYRDVSQRKVEASPEALKAVLSVLGVAENQKPDESLKLSMARRWRRPLEPVTVAWQDTGGHFELRLPETHPLKRVRARISLESGQSLALSLGRAAISKRARVDGQWYVSRKVPLPLGLASGYGALEVEADLGPFQSRLICAPRRAWAPDAPIPGWGVFLPLYATHTKRSWGAGDYSDLRELLEWAVQEGGAMISTLPLLPVFLPGDPSPYSPISKLFWNEFYVDIARAPEWALCAAARRQVNGDRLDALRGTDVVDYAGVMALKRAALEKMAGFFFSKPSERRHQFDRWAGEEVTQYASFRAATEARNAPWPRWPERMREGKLAPGDYERSALNYHLYAQWLAQEQMEELGARSRALGARLYLDMPLGVHGEGYDVWRRQKLFARAASGGAPPDAVFTKGQDWGFAPLHPRALREQGYDYVIAYLRHHLQHASALRFDHVMGLHRLFWIPHGLPASEGAYVRYEHEELYAILSLESHRYKSLIVGENLGTVPAAVNRRMNEHGIRKMYVVQYETRPDPKRALRPPPTEAVASLNTHDMPPFANYWAGLDVADRRALGLLKKNEMGPETRRRRALNLALSKFLHGRRLLKQGRGVGEVMRACLAFLAKSRAEWVLVNLEDLWLATLPQNTPGTTSQRVNWRVKAKYGLEQIGLRPEVMAGIQAVRAMRPKTQAKR